MTTPRTIDLFCRVVDNYGDIGVCWRLARQFAHEHGIAVRLWVDELASFARIQPGLDPRLDLQHVQGVEVRRWTDSFATPEPTQVADLVIEAFACDLPPAMIDAMARRAVPPAWINLEYLSAEAWVEGCHKMVSRHPSLGLVKHFFFPGFTAATGGLPVERDLAARRAAFQSRPENGKAFLASLGVQVPDGALTVSVFCYPGAPLDALLQKVGRDNNGKEPPVLLLVPEGVAREAVERFLGQPAHAGASGWRGAAGVHVLPFVEQGDYDRLLWSCDLNLVRGEDSFVRAQWAARPFVWHIYPQDDGAHWTKLDAFLSRFTAGLAPDDAAILRAMWSAWNGGGDLEPAWTSFLAARERLAMHALQWSGTLAKNGDLAAKLIQFAQEIG
ncbi:elongation factor P maturation arginine rhamnosyltransferase EarP [Noviherbaspirillum galbum]|uniref:Protein-arginine rhamnosyltransferase n=1 Tax=Noviherbaspirillum galbum TaxID=2709383 RepID=A0A6B3SRW4_9BURK|nr:elongation factor P maturation arginine rhamnosyltransferase EarP [Noviherbaspirillum galbum]NEX61526.1 elongation factor P maturation arginine rhamnosyltransferase EarP [Noviherbaspirillum galbum]